MNLHQNLFSNIAEFSETPNACFWQSEAYSIQHSAWQNYNKVDIVAMETTSLLNLKNTSQWSFK